MCSRILIFSCEFDNIEIVLRYAETYAQWKGRELKKEDSHKL